MEGRLHGLYEWSKCIGVRVIPVLRRLIEPERGMG